MEVFLYIHISFSFIYNSLNFHTTVFYTIHIRRLMKSNSCKPVALLTGRFHIYNTKNTMNCKNSKHDLYSASEKNLEAH